jgi:hypothetical protein
MITCPAGRVIISAMTTLRTTPRLLLVTDRPAPGAATAASPVRRYRLARLQSGRRQPAAPSVRNPV